MKIHYHEYTHDLTTLEAYISHPENVTEKLPAVLLLHAWQGRDAFVEQIANEFSAKGYIGVALDTYGKGVLGRNNSENSELMTPFMEDRAFLAQRLMAGLEAIKKLPFVNTKKIVVMGYCFGGLCALDLLRNAVDLAGVISVHGLLSAPEDYTPHYNAHIKVLALSGYNDPMVPPVQIEEFEREMDHAKVDWQLVTYGNTMHAFTNPQVNDKNFGTVYNASAAKRSKIAIDHFIQECFQVSV